MYLDNLFEVNTKIKRLDKCTGSYNECYHFWSNSLFERSLHLFHWNSGDTPEHEVEKTIMINGCTGIAPFRNKLTAFYGEYAGAPTEYYDIYSDFSVHSPIYSKQLKAGQDVAVIWQNSTRSSIYPLIHRYATMLAHTEVSLVNTLINGRDSSGIPVASTEAARKSIENYRNSLCNGKVMSIMDPAFSTVDFKSITTNTALNIKELIETRENLLNGFYHDIGIKTAWNKKGNMIVEEVKADDPMLLLNLSDMLEFRKRGCDEVNRLFGTNWTVELNPVIDYVEEGSNGNDNDKADMAGMPEE